MSRLTETLHLQNFHPEDEDVPQKLCGNMNNTRMTSEITELEKKAKKLYEATKDISSSQS